MDGVVRLKRTAAEEEEDSETSGHLHPHDHTACNTTSTRTETLEAPPGGQERECSFNT